MTKKLKGTKRPMNTGWYLKRVCLALVVLLVASTVLVGAGSAAEVWEVDDTSWYESSSTLTITSEEQLVNLTQLVNEKGKTFEGKTITLANDIALTEAWPGIGVYHDAETDAGEPAKAFRGIFDGQGYTISNVYFAKTDANKYRGFFNQLYKATVKNLNVHGHGFVDSITGTYGGAMIAGYASNSTIENCISLGELTGTHNVAGIAVRISDSKIIKCTNKADLTNDYSKLGGIVNIVQRSVVESTIEGCINEGTITSTARGEDGVGGIVGWIGYPNTKMITVKDCKNKGTITVTETATVGQIAAESWNGGHTFSGNKGLSTIKIAATGHAAMDGLNYATVADGVATYINDKDLKAGETYLVTAKITDVDDNKIPLPPAKPVIKLNPGESITFDTTLAKIDDSSITAAAGTLTKEEADNTVTYKVVAVAQIGENNYATLQDAINAASGEAVLITLLGYTKESGIIVNTDDDVIIDLKGNTVYGYFVVYGTATIKDGTIDSTVDGKAGIEVNNEADRTLNPTLTAENLIIKSGRHAIRVDGGTAIIDGGTYMAADAASNHAINISDGGDVTIESGTFNGPALSNGACVAIRNTLPDTPNKGIKDSKVTINGGTFKGGHDTHSSLTVWAGIATVTGGTFDSVYVDVPISISGGTFTTVNKMMGKDITGGTFGTDPSAYVAKGYGVEQADGKYIVSELKTAQIGDDTYGLLQWAVDDAKEGDIIILLLDTTEAGVPATSSGIKVPADKKITIDLGGKTLTGDIYSEGTLTVQNGNIKSDKWISAIESNGENAKLTVEDVTATSQRHALRIEGGEALIKSGTFTTIGIKDSTGTSHALNAGGAFKTTVTIESGTFNGIRHNGNAENPDSGAAVNAQALATVTINGGTYGYGQNDNLQVSNDGQIIVTGGTYIDQDPSKHIVDNDKYHAFKNDVDNTYTVYPYYTVIFNANGGDGDNTDTAQKVAIDQGWTFAGGNFGEKTGYTFADEWKSTVSGKIYAHSDAMEIDEEAEVVSPGTTVTLDAVWTPITYTVIFNDGAGATTTQEMTYDVPAFLSPNTFSKTGYTLSGWAEIENGAVVYKDGDEVINLTSTADANIPLYAVWDPITYIVKFDANGGTGEMVDQEMKYDEAETLTKNAFNTRTGYTFKEWNTEADGSGTYYTDEQSVKNLADESNEIVILYAQWKPITYIVEFDANGGTGNMDDQSMTYDNAENLSPNVFTNGDFNFAGWATSTDGDVIYANKTSVINLADEQNEVVTLYAIWTALSVYDPELPNVVVPYNGKEQAVTLDGYTIVYKLDGKEVTNPTNAGRYEVLISRDGGDTHEDYYTSVADGLVIEQVALTATYKGETIQYGDTPKLEVTVTGFVNGETPKTALDYIAPEVIVTNTAIGSYELTPVGGSALNYIFTTHESGTLTILEKDYPITEGSNQKVIVGSDATFESEASFSEFRGVKVDGVLITRDVDYTVTEGSTIVTLKASYINTLSAGPHTITIVSTYGSATTPFTVVPTSSGSSGSSGSSTWLQEPVTPTPTPTPTETVPTDTVPTDIPVTQPTATPSTPGFGVLAVLAGLGAVAAFRRQ